MERAGIFTPPAKVSPSQNLAVSKTRNETRNQKQSETAKFNIAANKTEIALFVIQGS